MLYFPIFVYRQVFVHPPKIPSGTKPQRSDHSNYRSQLRNRTGGSPSMRSIWSQDTHFCGPIDSQGAKLLKQASSSRTLSQQSGLNYAHWIFNRSVQFLLSESAWTVEVTCIVHLNRGRRLHNPQIKGYTRKHNNIKRRK